MFDGHGFGLLNEPKGYWEGAASQVHWADVTWP